jgi:[acyl-carrier-protein] S-malonyltransferase
MSTAVIFPGQGAQEVGLGRPWADHPAWGVVARAEAVADRPLGALLLEAEADELARTANTQLAMLVHSLVVWEAVRPELDDPPIAFAGHSLGQITALIAAGAVGFDDGVRLAVARADATQAAADERPGTMAAFLGLGIDEVEQICHDVGEGCWVANHNAPGQVAVAGTPAGVEAAIEGARGAGAKKIVSLDVGGAFHTPLMAAARDALASTLAATTFLDTEVPVVANHDGRPYRDGAGWPDRLGRHLVEPVRWHACSVTLAELGATRVLEVGASRLLWPMVRRSARGLEVGGVGVPDELTALRERAA